MKTSVESLGPVEKRLRVEIPADEVSAKVKEKYAEVKRHAPVRGFRPGKAPIDMVKRQFGDYVMSSVAEELINGSLETAAKENKLTVLSRPVLDEAKVVEGEPFSYTATFEVLPEVTPKDYLGLAVTRETSSVSDADVEKALDEIRESFAEYRAVERPAASGDLVDAVYSAKSGDESIAADVNHSFSLGSGYPLGKEFDAKIEGVKAGEERSFDVAYPDDSPVGRCAGKSVVFNVAAQAVREKKLPEINEEFVKNFDGIADLADLRVKLRERLVADGDERVRLTREGEIRDALLSANEFVVPPSMVEREMAHQVEETLRNLSAQGIDPSKIKLDPEKMRERFGPSAEKSVRMLLLLNAIADVEGLDAAGDDFEAEYVRMSEATKMDVAKVREFYVRSEDQLDALRDAIRRRKTMAFLEEKSVAKATDADAASAAPKKKAAAKKEPK